MEIKLYYTPRTRAMRVRWLLEELEVPYELIHVDLFGGETRSETYRAIHPLGHVPVISTDGRLMHETGAICSWLTEQFPQRQLAPSPGTEDWQDYQQWMYFVPGTVEPPVFYYFLHHKILPESQRVPEIVPWCRQRYESVLGMLEDKMNNKDYIVGNRFTTADIMLVSVLAWSVDFLAPYPSLQRYVKNLTKRPAFKAALSE